MPGFEKLGHKGYRKYKSSDKVLYDYANSGA